MMPVWLEWLVVVLAAWLVVASVAGFALARVLGAFRRSDPAEVAGEAPGHSRRLRLAATNARGRTRILLVEDDPAFRALVVATLAGEAFEVAEAETADEARSVAASFGPDLVVLDVSLPDANGLVFCAELQETDDAPEVVLLTGRDIGEEEARLAGAQTVLHKPFSPLALLEVIERLAGEPALPTPALPAGRTGLEDSEQLIVYARDLARVIGIERTQRQLLENAYRQTVSALASTLEARDTGTNLHSLRVTRYALELAGHSSPELLADSSIVYGFLLHDIGKIGLPDRILLKEGPLDPFERRLMQRHPEIGEEILADVAILHGEGLAIVRSHHERWDGAGYPDALAGETISRSARIFAVADALDALTNDRPYRLGRDWNTAIDEIAREAGRQFDPEVVDTLLREEHAFRSIHEEMAPAA